MNGPNELTLVL